MEKWRNGEKGEGLRKGGGVNLSRGDEQSTNVKDLLREALPPWGERRIKATPGSKLCGRPAG